jgi:MtrB/PioB family decaheme-associated outer membrane protein
MRTRTVLFVAALLAGWAPVAGAQQAAGQQPADQTATATPWHITLANWLDGGVRVTDTTGDQARFERFRDPRTGPFLDRLRLDKDNGTSLVAVAVDNVGYRDQRYFAQFEVPGTVRFSGEWNQVPTFWSINTRSAYSGAGTSVQTLPAGLATAVQAASSSLIPLYTAQALANAFDTRSRRDTLTLNLLYTPTPNLDVNVNLSSARKNGDEPWGMSFGFGQTVEVAAPVDTRTTDLAAGAEWNNSRGMLRVNYDGSWFTDHQDSLTIDNPSRAIDSPTAGSSRGRTALWPGSTSHTVTGAGAIRLAGHSRLTASLAVGTWRQDQTLLPATINTAIATPSLPRTSAQTDARRIATNIVFTTRPATMLGITARYRLYDFNDRTPDYSPFQLVQYDQSNDVDDVIPVETRSIFNHRDNALDVEATLTRFRAVSISGGYRLNRDNRTERVFGITTDNAVFASVDSASTGIVSLHGVFEHARRRGSEYDEEVLLDAGEYPGLRRFDIADRDRNRVTAMLQVMPVANLAVSGSITATKDTFPDQQYGTQDTFGLQDRNSQGYAVFLDATPSDAVTVGGGFGYQLYKTSQQSRQVSTGGTVPLSGQQLDPRRDWTLSEDEKVRYVAANLELAHLFPKTAVRFTYDYNRAESPYTYGIPTPGVLSTPTQLPPVINRWHTATIDIRYFLRRNLAAGLMYWYDRYTVDDFALGSQIEDKPAIPGIILLGYGFRPYRANSFWARLLYLF